MEGRKPEDLRIDCLVEVFSKTELESLLFDLPLVCKHWHRATRDPLCWQNLKFPEPPALFLDRGHFEKRLSELRKASGLVDPPAEFSTTELIKFVINRRSKGCATIVHLPTNCTEEALVCVADKCPNLQKLALPFRLDDNLVMMLPALISKWKNLMVLDLECNVSDLQPMLEQISSCCKNFVYLNVRSYISKDDIFAIATFLPNIKYLILGCVCDDFEREDLVKILECCKELVRFTLKGGFYFQVDDEIRELASHIKRFVCEHDSELIL